MRLIKHIEEEQQQMENKKIENAWAVIGLGFFLIVGFISMVIH